MKKCIILVISLITSVHVYAYSVDVTNNTFFSGSWASGNGQAENISTNNDDKDAIHSHGGVYHTTTDFTVNEFWGGTYYVDQSVNNLGPFSGAGGGVAFFSWYIPNPCSLDYTTVCFSTCLFGSFSNDEYN